MLAGYIFGGNETNQKIAMTSPVSMSMNDSTEMKFMIPSNYELEDLPKPNNENIKFNMKNIFYLIVGILIAIFFSFN